MKRLLFASMLVVGIIEAAEWVNITTQERGRPNIVGDVHNPDRPTLLAGNWRELYDEDRLSEVAPDFQRTDVAVSQHPLFSDRAIETSSDLPIPTNALPSDDPLWIKEGIETPVVVLVETNSLGKTNAWGVIISDGIVLTYLDHESPRPSPEVLAERIAQVKGALREIKTSVKAVRDTVDTNITAIAALSFSSFTVAQKTQLNALTAKVKIQAQQEKALARQVLIYLKGE